MPQSRNSSGRSRLTQRSSRPGPAKATDWATNDMTAPHVRKTVRDLDPTVPIRESSDWQSQIALVLLSDAGGDRRPFSGVAGSFRPRAALHRRHLRPGFLHGQQAAAGAEYSGCARRAGAADSLRTKSAARQRRTEFLRRRQALWFGDWFWVQPARQTGYSPATSFILPARHIRICVVLAAVAVTMVLTGILSIRRTGETGTALSIQHTCCSSNSRPGHSMPALVEVRRRKYSGS